MDRHRRDLFNDAYSAGTLRSAAAQLSESVFACKVQPILQASCASCHQASRQWNQRRAGEPELRFEPVRTDGKHAGGFRRRCHDGDGHRRAGCELAAVAAVAHSHGYASASRDRNHAFHTFLPSGSANYNSIRAWIAGTLTCQ